MASNAPHINLFSSRDFKHYQPVLSSHITDIASRFYEFLSSDSPQASHARFAYATAYVGTEPRSEKAFAGSELDEEVRNMLREPPVIVLAQGPMHPWGLFERAATQDSSSSSASELTSASSLDMSQMIEPVSAIFLPWTIHQILKEGYESGEEQETSVASFFALACMVHETAHWIAANRHGYKHDPEREASKTSIFPKINFGNAKITTHSRRDWGTHAKELLLGSAFTFMSYADGTHEIVLERIKPVISKLHPSLSPELIVQFTNNPIPPIVDVSKYGAPQLHEAPRWRKSDFLVVSCMSPDFSCHHGACRLREK